MVDSFFVELIENASMLLALGIVFNVFLIRSNTSGIRFQVFFGCCIGLVGVLLMLSGVHLSEGVYFDTRSIAVSVTGLFLGPLPTLIGAGIVILFRLLTGGAGALTGILVTVSAAAIGLLWRRLRFDRIWRAPKAKVWFELYLFGLAVHAAMLLCMFTLPEGLAIPTLQQIALPVLLVYPVATLLLCILIYTRMMNLRLEKERKKREELIQELIDQSPVGIAVTEGRRILSVNPAFEQIFGRTSDELIRLGFDGITHPDDREMSHAAYDKMLSGENDGFDLEKRYLRPDGSILWGYLSVVPIRQGGVRTGQNMCMIKDITEIEMGNQERERKDAECRALYQQYQEKQRLLVSLLNSIPDLIFYKNTEFVYMGCNKAFETFAGKREEDLVGRTDFDLFDKDTAMLFREMDLKMIEQKAPRRNEETVTAPDGSRLYLETLKTPYYDADGNVLGLIGISRDITMRKEKEEEIQYLNYHDTLTGLYNRAYFEQARRQMDGKGGLPLSVIIGDINGLKLINDAFGHAEGDQMLRTIGGIMKRTCRPTDVISRTGGDEFTILLPNTAPEAGERLLAKIKKACEETTVQAGEAVYHTSISLGLATKTSPDITFDRVMRIAEEHMYRQKLLQQQSLHSSIINSIKRTMQEKSNETEAHAERMGAMARQLGTALGLGEADLVSLELLATLHDIGKISVDRDILMKTGPLNEVDWLELKKHPEVGYRITNASPELRHISKYILYHHERWDGTGYPHRLRGEKIPLLSRIIAVVDAYDAMTQNRPYRKAVLPEAAAEEIRKNAGTQFDPDVAKVFLEQVLSGEPEAREEDGPQRAG